jgi:hypothetical protein
VLAADLVLASSVNRTLFSERAVMRSRTGTTTNN